MNLSQIQTLLSSKNNAVNQRLGEKKALEDRIEELSKEVEELTLDSRTNEKAVWLLQQYADHQQKEVIEKVETIVTSGIKAVFQNETLEFKLYYSETKAGSKKKNPEITMAVFYDYGGEQKRGDIKNSFGGGLSVVVSTLLRVVFVMFLSSAKRIRPILVLDEPLKDLSPEYPDQDTAASGYRDRMAMFLRTLADETGTQILMVSHEQNYSDVSDVDYRFHGSIGKSPRVTKKVKQDIDGGM